LTAESVSWSMDQFCQHDTDTRRRVIRGCVGVLPQNGRRATAKWLSEPDDQEGGEMSPEPDDPAWRSLCQVADEETTNSFKRTINAAIVLRAARPLRVWSTGPRKAAWIAALLGLLGLLVSRHEQSLWMLLHHLGV